MFSQGDESKLKRRIGFFGLLAMCVGLNIGGALFALTPLAAVSTGPSLPFALLLSVVPVLLALVPYSVLSTTMPVTSGTYRYAQLLSPTWALVVMLTLAVCICIGGQPLYGLAFGKYLSDLVPHNPRISGFVMLAALYLVNLFGIKMTAWVQSALFVALIIALLIYVILGFPHISTDNLVPLFPHGPSGLLVAMGLLYTFSAGGFFVVDLGGEVLKASKVLPKVLLTGMIIVIVLYFLILFVTVGVVPWRQLEGETLLAAAHAFMGRNTLVFFIICGALVASITTVNIVYCIVSRGLLVVAQEGLLPSFIGHINSRFGTPHWALTLTFVISSFALFLVPSLMFFGSMLNLGIISAITLVAAAGFVLPLKFPELCARSGMNISKKRLRIASLFVVLLNSGLFLFFIVAIGEASLVFAGVMFSMFLVALSKRKQLSAISKHLNTNFNR